jgi:site-specific recombinase XerD
MGFFGLAGAASLAVAKCARSQPPPDNVASALSIELLGEDDLAAVAAYIDAEKSPTTRKLYRDDFARFERWCIDRSLSALPASPLTVSAFLSWEADRRSSASTVGRRAAAIRYVHKRAGLATPTDDENVRATIRGIRRTVGVAPKKKSPATAARVIAMAQLCRSGPAGTRDRALLLLGFAGALRRSELVAINVEHVAETPQGLLVHVPRSKTDQEGSGTTIAIPRGKRHCPVAAYRRWIETGRLKAGPVFRPIDKAGSIRPARLTDRSVANIIKAYAARAGLDPADFSGHSLRAGFLTTAAANGASIFKMMDVSRHRSVDSLRGYIRNEALFDRHAGSGLL